MSTTGSSADPEKTSRQQRYDEKTRETMSKEERQSLRRADAERRKARHRRRQARCPQFSISLQGPSSLSLSTLSFAFTATLHYHSEPSNTGRHVLLPSDHGPLHPDAIRSGCYCMYTSAECKPSERVNYKRYGGCFRAPRFPDGRIITPAKYDISFEDGYRDLAPGEELSNEVFLDLSESSQWRELLHVGEVYWLRYEEDQDTAKAALGHLGLPPGWRYGKLSDYEHVQADWRDDQESVYIPLAISNTICFQVVE